MRGSGSSSSGRSSTRWLRICEAPERFALWPSDQRYRRAVRDRFPFVVVFELHAAGVELVAVAHVTRPAGYGADRSQP